VIDVDRIAIGPQVAGQGRLSLVAPLAVSGSVDFSRGEQVTVSARFSGLADWQIEVTQGQASRELHGSSYAVDERWDGLADVGEFGPGAAGVVLLYRRPGSQDAWERAEATVAVKGAHSPQVQVNQVGYLPQAGKIAYVTGLDLPRDFVVKSADGEVAMRGRSTAPEFYQLAGERVARMDLSGLTAPGTYVVQVDGVGRSFPFRIGKGVYDDLLSATMKSYYYQRCGMDLAEPYAGTWTHRACHTDDAYVYAGYADGHIVSGEHVASTGGWHDAGDYGKKIVPAATALSYLLRLAEMFPEKIGAVPVNVPGDERLPGYLREVKYELDWFLTMQRPDGAVYHLITSPDFFTHDMPEKDPQRRYLVPVSSCATADFAAAMAVAGRVYHGRDAAFAARCLDASRRAWAFLGEHPDIVPAEGYADPKGINGTGTYGDKDDRDERFWAACELYAATRDGQFLDYVKANYGNWKPLFGATPGWMDTHLYGVYSIVLAEGVDEKLQSLFRAELVAQADRMVGVVRASPYSMTIDVEKYWWNNATMLEYGAQLLIAHAVTGNKDYADCALLQMGYVLGCNPMDYCYVSGFGTKSTKDIWQGASANDGIAAPVPGFVVPGPCLVAWDAKMSAYRELHSLPVMKTYQDDHAAYSVNEVCLPFNAPMVFSAGYLVLHGESAAR
jgi:endoglucanase